MKPFEKRGLFSHILPALARMPQTENASELVGELADAKVFDCRALPIGFVIDAGDAAYHEFEELRELPKLPFDCCYFEFQQDIAVAAIESAMYWIPIDEADEDEDDKELRRILEDPVLCEQLPTTPNTVTLYAFPTWAGTSPTDYRLEDQGDGEFCRTIKHREGPGHFNNFYPNDGKHYEGHARAERGKFLLLGTLSLLADKLLTKKIVPDPVPKLNRKRMKQGRLPVSSETHLLNINVPAVRAAVRPALTIVGTHESPSLHWRRGHWRVLHRGSEFENRTWVRKCLVGDPARGYIKKEYRLSNEMPMIPAVEPEIPVMIGVNGADLSAVAPVDKMA